MCVICRINDDGWHDWSFDSLNAEYEKISVNISYNNENYYKIDGTVNENFEEHIKIHCNNHIGYSFIGHWDENIIESIKIEREGDLVASSLSEIKRLNGNPPIPSLGGGLKKIDNIWYQLNIKLIDGSVIKVACESFELEYND